MITYLPEIYPDELVYSWFCRYYVHSGYLIHKAALTDIYSKRSDNPSKEFLGHINTEMLSAIQRIYSINTLVLEHTMFSQYAKFIPLEQKKTALERISGDFCDVHHLFSVLPRNVEDAFLKYCPICAMEDREKYGEAYWHRSHQIRGIAVCPKHNCMLENSSVTSKSEQTFTFCPADKYAVKQDVSLSENKKLIEFAEYQIDVFGEAIDFEKDIPIGAILYNEMKASKYISNSGKTRHTKRLADDIKVFYEKIGLSNIASFYQIQRVLHGDRFDFSVVCQIACFLGISAKKLTAPDITEKQIIGERKTHKTKDKIDVNWTEYDTKMAPILERVAKGIYDGSANKNGRPERVSERRIYREMGLPSHRLEILPQCKSVFEKYTETYEENWARRIVWAYDKLKREGKPFYWSNIRKLAGVKKENAEKIMPLIEKNAEGGMVDILSIFFL